MESIKNSKIKKLIKEQNLLSILFSFIVLFIYFLFIGIIGFKPDIFSLTYKDTGITIGILYGLFIIIFSIILTIFYVFVANKRLDKLREQIKKDNE